MKQKKLMEVKKMARDAGYHDVRVIGKWNGWQVAKPIFSDDITHYVGYPQYILVKNDKIRWTSSYKESDNIMDKLQV